MHGASVNFTPKAAASATFIFMTSIDAPKHPRPASEATKLALLDSVTRNNALYNAVSSGQVGSDPVGIWSHDPLTFWQWGSKTPNVMCTNPHFYCHVVHMACNP